MDESAANATLSLIARVVALGKKATNVQYEEALQAAREVILQQKELNLNLRDENRAIKEKLAMAEEFVLGKSVRWKKEDADLDQPFCPACYAKGQTIPLQKTWEGRPKTQSLWSCPNKSCGATFNPWDYKEPDSPSPTFQPFYTPGDY